MNLFIEDLANYLTREWDRMQADKNGTHEARFIVESLSPSHTFQLLAKLDEKRLKVSQTVRLECHFKVARGLWDAWQNQSGLSETDLIQQMRELGGVDYDGTLRWIDQEDRLTWYRNLTKPQDKDALVVVLIGLGHTSDQGGLADFHLINEERLWQEMGKNYQRWLQRLAENLGLDGVKDAQIERFDQALKALFAIKPRNLLRLAEFLASELLPAQDYPESLDAVLVTFYERLPFWDIPPLLFDITQVTKSKETKDAIKDAAAFISHHKLKTKADHKNAFKRLNDWFAKDDFVAPQTVGNAKSYVDEQDYQATLETFIYNGDSQARKRLLKTDARALVKTLKTRTKGLKGSTQKKRLRGSSVEAFLLAIFETVKLFAKACRDAEDESIDWVENLAEIHVTIERFNHDLDVDADNSIDGKTLAEELLQGCLGGLAELLGAMDLRLPVDEEQAALPFSQWERPVVLAFNLTPSSYRLSRQRPHVSFTVNLIGVGEENDRLEYRSTYDWALEPTHAERVRFQCVKAVLDAWKPGQFSQPILPAFTLSREEMTALYFAADEDEANRLLNNAINMVRVVDLMADLDRDDPLRLDVALREAVQTLSRVYRDWLVMYEKQGYFVATATHYQALQPAYEHLAAVVLDTNKRGSAEVLRRFYKAFLLFEPAVQPNDAFLRSALVTGIAPAVLELTWARDVFLRNYFGEILAEFVREQDIKGQKTKQVFDRLLNLVTIQRPLAALVVDDIPKLSAKIKGFNLLHYLGEQPSGEKSLAVQTLLREEDDNDEELHEIRHLSEDSKVISKVLRDYQSLYAFAADGLRIIAVHVKDVPLILSGVDSFLREYLKETPTQYQPAFFCELMVYSTSSSPLAVEKKLTAWRDDVEERFREKGRRLNLSVGHRFAPTREKIAESLRKEQRLYDIALLFRFLGEDMTGKVEPAEPFTLNFDNLSKFPISEYPRPIQRGNALRRQSLLSNRRLRIQTWHADMSARLCHPQDNNKQHLLFGDVDYTPWQAVIESLHQKAQWVACIDPFIDKLLFNDSGVNSQRKVVGFTSGLGAYGELNLSISTEQDTLTHLTALVKNHLHGLLPFQSRQTLDTTASRIVDEAEAIIGLSSLRAVISQGEKIREVVGFAAIHRLLAEPTQAIMTQLLPLDSFLHWFSGSDTALRPDLLQLSLTVRENDIPLVEAKLIECKLAKQSERHLEKARDQVQEGLSHLTQLFAPNRRDIQRSLFDRRYWWAQLQRALTSRTVVSLSDDEQKHLNAALENVIEGHYEMTWESAIFTFWTDVPDTTPVLNPYPLANYAVAPPFQIPPQCILNHWVVGYNGLLALFENSAPKNCQLEGEAIRILPEVVAPYAPLLAWPAVVPPVIEPPPKPIIPETWLPPVQELPHEELPRVSVVMLPVDVKPLPPVVPEPSKEPVLVANTPVASPAVAKTLSSVPERLLIGTRVPNGEPVYWHYGHPGLANRHLLVFGSSGSGKTYGIQCLLAEMAAQQQHSLIIDYTDGFLPAQVEPRFTEVAQPKNHYVRVEQLPLNPFRRQSQIIDPDIPPIEENPFDVATRVASIFTSVFDMGDQQSATLIRVLEAGIANHAGFTLNDVLPLLREQGQSGETLANKLEPFIKSQPFKDSSGSAWEAMMGSAKAWVNVLQLKGLSRDIYRIVTEFALWDLYDYACNTGSKNRPIPVVLDEIQNLNHRSDSPIDKMLREGRKFGLSLILATQTTSNFDKEQRDRLFQAGHKLFFKPADTEINAFADILSTTSRNGTKAEWAEKLSKLEKGQCYSLGPVLTSGGTLRVMPLLVSVTALDARGFGG